MQIAVERPGGGQEVVDTLRAGSVFGESVFLAGARIRQSTVRFASITEFIHEHGNLFASCFAHLLRIIFKQVIAATRCRIASLARPLVERLVLSNPNVCFNFTPFSFSPLLINLKLCRNSDAIHTKWYVIFKRKIYKNNSSFN